MIPALVLTAGLATRLRPLSFVRAKAAVPVAGEPLVRRILRRLAAAGVTDAVLNLHHLPHTLTRVVGDGSDLAIRVRYSWEMPVLGSAGGPRRALPLLVTNPEPGARHASDSSGFQVPGSTFLIVNGDTLTDVDVAGLVAAHRTSDALVTMAVVPSIEPEKYGGVLVDAHGAVTGFTRRASRTLAPSHPRTLAPPHPRTLAPSHPPPPGFGEASPRTLESTYHFVGVQVAEAEAFAALADGIPAESVSELYPSLIRARPGAVRAYVSSAAFLDIGTPGDYLQTSLLLAARERDGALHATLFAKTARIDPTARVEASILWDDVEVGAGAMLRECVVTDGVRVPADTSWTGVTIRAAGGELSPGERRIDGLAIASL